MVVRGLEAFLKERNLVRKDPLSVLKDTRIGIDGFHWLRTRVFPTEAFSPALGAVPFTLRSRIKKELTKLREAGITPVFVFNGLQLNRNAPGVDPRQAKRNMAWDAYEQGKKDAAVGFWSYSAQITADTINFTMQVLRENNVEFFRAPYLSAAQLVWLEQPKQGYVHAIYGSTDLMLFNVARVILSMDTDEGTFTWADRGALLGDTGLNDEQLCDACLFAGMDACPTFPAIDTNLSNSYNQSHSVFVTRAIELLVPHGNWM
eukprot:Opistho-2@89323